MRNRILFQISILYLILCIPFVSLATKGEQIPIEQIPSTSFPIIIEQPGNYILVSDLTVTTPDTHCLKINVDDVIIDLNGYSLIGPGECSQADNCSGIYVAMKKNISIINGTIRQFGGGINLSSSFNNISNINTEDNIYFGIKANLSRIVESSMNNNGAQGLLAVSCTITDCTSNNNLLYGIEAEDCTIVNCITNNNQSHGIYTRGKCRLENCIFERNQGFGLYLGAENSHAIKNQAKNNTLGNYFMEGKHYLPLCGMDANLELED